MKLEPTVFTKRLVVGSETRQGASGSAGNRWRDARRVGRRSRRTCPHRREKRRAGHPRCRGSKSPLPRSTSPAGAWGNCRETSSTCVRGRGRFKRHARVIERVAEQTAQEEHDANLSKRPPDPNLDEGLWRERDPELDGFQFWAGGDWPERSLVVPTVD